MQKWTSSLLALALIMLLCSATAAETFNGKGSVVATGTGSFSLPASATRVVNMPSNISGVLYGHVLIEWTSEDTHLRKALIATLTQVKSGSLEVGYAVPVNGGQPF